MRKLRLLFLIIILGSLFSGENLIFSQNYPFREYTVRDGLPQCQSSGIYQDKRGYLWILTRNGLSLFDGIEFVNFFKKDGLGSNAVNQIIEDSDGYLYAISANGVSKFDGRKFIYYPPPADTVNFDFTAGSATELSGNILIHSFSKGHNHGRLMSFKNGIYSDYSKKYNALDTLDIRKFEFENENNELIILDDKGNAYSWKNNEINHISGNKFTSVFFENDKMLFTGKGGLFEYSKGKLIPVSNRKLSELPEIRTFSKSELDGFLGLLTERSEVLTNAPYDRITGYTIDYEGNIWIGTEQNFYHLISTAFSSFSSSDGLVKNIWALVPDKNGHIWIGSLYGDLQEYDGKEFRLRNEYKHLFKEGIGFFKGSRLMSDGDVYFSTNQGVLIWDGKNFSRLKGIPDNTQVCYIYEDNISKAVLVGTDKGLYVVKGEFITEYKEFNDKFLGVIEGIVRYDSGMYWLSGHKGLLKFDGSNTVHVNDSILPQVMTYTLDLDSKGGFWVTSEEGLFFKAKNSSKFMHGLPERFNKPANSLILMDSSQIMIGRTTDICIINLDKFYDGKPDYYKIYDKSDGFSGNDCLDNGIIKDKQGRFLILTSGGVDVLEPKYLKLNILPPRTFITLIEAETDTLTWEVLNDPSLFYDQNQELKLNRKQNTLRISFTGISTTNPEKVTYQYRLSGFEEKWSKPEFQRKVIYEKLAPGNYTFQVKAFNADGIGNEKPCSISIRIKPAIWQTNIFKIFILFIIIATPVLSTWKIMKYRQRVKAEHLRLQSELSQLHMASVLKQFDPHFTFNVLSSVGSLIMKGEKDLAYDYLLKLSALLRTVVTNGTAIIKPLSEELDFVTRYCEVQKLRFKERFEWSLKVDKNVDLQFEIPKLTIQIFVENAIKHGIEPRLEGGRVDINLFKNSGGLNISIIDNGIGREAARNNYSSGTGNGIKIISGLLEQMNTGKNCRVKLDITDLFNSDKKASGTAVNLIIPDGYHFGFDEQI